MGGTREGPPAPGLRGVGFCPHRATEVLHGPGRQGSSEGEDKGQELDRMQERKAAHRRREKARRGGARPSGTSSRTRVREWSGHKGCMRPCPEPWSPQAGEGRGPRTQQQLTGEAAPRAGRPSWSWHPGPPRAQRRITCPGCAPAPRLTLLRRERQLPGMQRQLQGGVLLGHEGLQVQREGHDVLPDLKHGAARLARHDAPGERLSRGACA